MYIYASAASPPKGGHPSPSGSDQVQAYCLNSVSYPGPISHLFIAALKRAQAHREAYATILHSVHVYVCGAIAAAQGIQNLGPRLDFLDEHDVVSGQADNGSVAGIEAVATIRSS
ncbi:hypothetical protein ACFX15_018043 [Malus domestica]